MSSSHFIFEANQSPSIDLDGADGQLECSDIKDYEFYSTRNEDGDGSTSTKSQDHHTNHAAIDLFELAIGCTQMSVVTPQPQRKA